MSGKRFGDMSFHTEITIRESSEIGAARRMSANLAEESGLNETKRGAIAIVVTELATNLVRYAKNGRLLMRSSVDSGFEVLAIDQGPGMNVSRCMEDGYSTVELLATA